MLAKGSVRQEGVSEGKVNAGAKARLTQDIVRMDKVNAEGCKEGQG